jgi:glucose-1-phosphate adenylyltransferase
MSSFTPSLGEFIEAIPPQHRIGEHFYLGTADAVYQNLPLIDKEEMDYILILGGDHIYRMDYTEMLKFHEEKGADITVGAVQAPILEGHLYGIIHTNTRQEIIRFLEKPEKPPPVPDNPRYCLASMGIYVFKPEALFSILHEDAQDAESQHDFGRNIVPKMTLSKKYKIYAYNFVDKKTKKAIYWRDIGHIKAFYDANMDQVHVVPELDMYDRDWPIRTAPIYAPPPKFILSDYTTGRVGMALNSLVAPGCIISGAKIEGSVVGPFVRVDDFAHVQDSVIFENVAIGKHVKIKNAIVDANINIPDETQIGYNIEEDKKRFFVSPENIVVVSPDATF